MKKLSQSSKRIVFFVFFVFTTACGGADVPATEVAPAVLTAPAATSIPATATVAVAPAAPTADTTETAGAEDSADAADNAPPPRPTAVPSDVMLDINELADFQAVFNEFSGRPRLILFLTAGCPSCLAGARWLQSAVLDQDPALDVAVFAVWFTTVPANMLPSDLNGRRDESVLNDPRVIHFWDRSRAATEYFAQTVGASGPDRSSLDNTYGGARWGQQIWDAYFLYDATSTWGETAPTGLVGAGYPLVNEREAMRQALNPALPAVDADLSGAVLFAITSSESSVTYGVAETFVGQDYNYAIGVTDQVAGEILVDLDNPANSQVGQIQVTIEAFASDNFLRDERIREQFLESATYPVATFVPTAIDGLPATYTAGETLTFTVTGDLTVREETVATTFAITAAIVNGRLVGTATAQVLMTDFGFDPPAIAGMIAAENEVDITLNFVADVVE